MLSIQCCFQDIDCCEDAEDVEADETCGITAITTTEYEWTILNKNLCISMTLLTHVWHDVCITYEPSWTANLSICPVLGASAGAFVTSWGRMFRVPPGAFLRAGRHQGRMGARIQGIPEFSKQLPDNFIMTCLLRGLNSRMLSYVIGRFVSTGKAYFIQQPCQILRHLSCKITFLFKRLRWPQYRQEKTCKDGI